MSIFFVKIGEDYHDGNDVAEHVGGGHAVTAADNIELMRMFAVIMMMMMVVMVMVVMVVMVVVNTFFVGTNQLQRQRAPSATTRYF